MKFLITLYTFLVLQLSWGNSSTDILTDINNKYQIIRELVEGNALRQLHTAYQDENNKEKGELTFYYNGNELKHVKHVFLEKNIVWVEEYYIWDDQLFLQYNGALQKEQEINFNTLQDIDLEYTGAYYYYNEQPFPCLIDQGNAETLVPKVSCEQAIQVRDKFHSIILENETKLQDPIDFPKNISRRLADDVYYQISGMN